MISVKIDVSKIDKSALYKGAKGTYLNITLMDNQDGQPDEYGNDYWVVQDLGAERRKAGEKGPKLGNARNINVGGGNEGGGARKFADKVQPAKAFQNRPKPAPAQEEAEDDIPF
jgi:hypothetical protein